MLLDVLIVISFLLIVLTSNNQIILKYKLPSKYAIHLNYLLFYHLLFSLIFTLYISFLGGDSRGYWFLSITQLRGEYGMMHYMGTGTSFMGFLNYIPSKILGLSYLTGNILYGLLGFIGIRYLYVMTYTLFPANFKILNFAVFPAVFYLPNLHFWTSGVAKDTLCFWGIAWFFFAIQNYKKCWWQGIFALFIVYYIRPHVGLAVLGGTTMALILGSEIKRQYKFVLFFFTLAGTIYFSDQTLQFLGMEDFSLESVGAFSESQIGYLNRGRVGSAVDLAAYSFPLRIFTYLFRPLIFDAHNLFSLIISFENLLYLWFSFYLLRNFSLEAFRDAPVFIKAGIFTFIPITFAFANSLSNLGITMRMKNMTMIYFILFIFYLIVYRKKIQFIRYKEKLNFLKARKEAKKKYKKVPNMQ